MLTPELLMEALLATLGGLALITFNRVAEDLKSITMNLQDLTQSIGELNTRIAVIIEKVEGHERRLEKLEGDDV